MAIETHIPRLHMEIFAFEFLCQEFNLLYFVLSLRLICLDKIVEQLVYVFHVCCHTMFQNIVGKGIIAQELSHLAAQIDESLANLYVVSLVEMQTLSILCHI